jgi:mannose-1-phosphate guanylyltransferase/phosphomannomutase
MTRSIWGKQILVNSVRMFALAGGRGDRFFPFSTIIPKCLIPVAGKPCLRWIVEDAIQQEFTDVVLCVNRRDESNFKYEFRDLKLKYSVSEEPTGTVDELSRARGLVDGTFILRYGDDLTEIDYGKLLQFHREKEAALTLGATAGFRLPVGILDTDSSGRVVKFTEKPRLERPSWIGIGVFEPGVMSYLRAGEDIAADTISRMLEAGERVYSFVVQNGWYDVGNIEHWRMADDYFRKNKSTSIRDASQSE